MDSVVNGLKTVSDLIWGGGMAFGVFSFAVWASAYFHFPQKKLGYALKESVRPQNSGSGLSALSCLAMNLAATLGVGNIIGVAIAIELGGPGSVFWCCAAGLFAMAISYGESLLSLRFRKRTSDGTYAGGPMYVLEYGLGKKRLGILFAAVTALTGLSMGAMVSANSISSALTPVSIPPMMTGLVLAILTAAVVIGGMRSIADFCTKVVPLMVAIFVLGCAVVLAIERASIWEAICLILSDAFDIRAIIGAAVGGGVSKAIQYGISRGVFSNEAGMGSSAITAAAMKDGDPVRQALICSTATFWDTCVLCALTGVTFVSAMTAHPSLFTDTHGFDTALRVFSVIPAAGEAALTIVLLLLGFSSIIGWSYVGMEAFSYLFGRKKRDIYRFLWVVAVFLGAVAPIDAVWYFSDICTAAMMLPNLWSVYRLRDICRGEMETFCDKKSRIRNVHRIFTHK